MHGLSTGHGIHEQKSTEFMQVMTSVLQDTDSVSVPTQTVNVNEFSINFRQQLETLSKLIEPRDLSTRQHVQNMQ